MVICSHSDVYCIFRWTNFLYLNVLVINWLFALIGKENWNLFVYYLNIFLNSLKGICLYCRNRICSVYLVDIHSSVILMLLCSQSEQVITLISHVIKHRLSWFWLWPSSLLWKGFSIPLVRWGKFWSFNVHISKCLFRGFCVKIRNFEDFLAICVGFCI